MKHVRSTGERTGTGTLWFVLGSNAELGKKKVITYVIWA
jgi:hypothetical protein